MSPARLLDYIEGYKLRAVAAIEGSHPLHPETELAAANQMLGEWKAAFGRIPTEPEPRCEACEED